MEIAAKGDVDRYDECQKIFDEAAQIGLSDDFGHSIYDLMEKALSSDYTVSIPQVLTNSTKFLVVDLTRER